MPPVTLSPRSRSVVFAAVAAGLLALLAATWALARVQTSRVDAADGVRVQAETIAAVRRALSRELEAMDELAEDATDEAAVRDALTDTLAARGAFLALDDLDRDGDTSVEVVTADGRLVAWSGDTFPRSSGAPPSRAATGTVVDGAGRRALAVWRPVTMDGVSLGAVRVVRLAQAAVPVRNRYLQDYDLADDWRRGIDAPFEVRFSRNPRVATDEALVGPDGTVLGRVVAPVPSVRAIVAAVQAPLQSAAALWAALLLAWLLVGLGWGVQTTLAAADRAPTRRAWTRALGALAAFTLGVVAARYGLLALDVPVRWLDAARRPAALFDPAYFATDLGAGLFRSAGDLVLTAGAALVVAGAALASVLRYADAAGRSGTRSAARRLLGLVAAAAAGPLAALAVAALAERAVLDATLDYSDRTASVADPLSLAVLAGLAAVAAAAAAVVAGAVVLACAGLRPHGAARRRDGPAVALLTIVATGVAAALAGAQMAPAAGLAALGGGLALVLAGHAERWVWPLTFRGTLAGALLLAPVLYGLVQGALQERTDATLVDAAQTFADTRDSRVSFAIEQILAEARADDALRPALLGALAYADSLRRAGSPVGADSTRPTVDDLVGGLVTNSLLGSLVDVATELQLVSPAGDTLGRFSDGAKARRAPGDPLTFGAMQQAFLAAGDQGFILRSAPDLPRRGLSRTAAIGPLARVDGEPVAWLYVRATPRPARVATETPFPRVLAPAGLFGLDDEALAYAEYENGALVRNRGAAALALDPAVVARLAELAPRTGGGVFLTRRLGGATSRAYAQPVAGDARRVVVVRTPTDERADVLFVLLRLSLAGFVAGVAVWLVGLPIRRRLGLLPAARTRFRDKVLNRFLAVGLASVVLTGVVGQSAIAEQNRQSVRDLLAQRLQRAEAALALNDLPPGDLRAASARLDDAAAALGVDVHLYRGAELEASSRRQLVRQRLIEPRLPGPVYRALYLDGDPYAFAETRLGYGPGAFVYTTAYKALADASGRPAAVVAVPTLSEQGAIEVGQARMVAYLFGGLLLLLVAIAGFAVLLAGQLTGPFGRLREGLRAVGASDGGAADPIPVETRDEVGELVETFNAMQAQLVESRRRLAAQERELAWSEMARQVAHEIKNPLMPMKLSVQHLQRTYRPPPDDATPAERDFAARFERTSAMLIDQIDTLTRIASDFSTFARMPNRAPEPLDLGGVAREAAALFESPLADSQRATFHLDLASGPLPVVADHEELRRVLVNLLTNALQAIPDGRDGHVTLSTAAENGTAAVRVADDGAGIAPDVQAKVFQPSFSTKTSGMGLGLAISKRAVEAAGGSISFETADGAGTTFTVRLPLAPDGDLL